MSEPVYGRLPTEADGKWVQVWLPAFGRWSSRLATSVDKGDIWMRQPPPPKPPIDTSLAASIERWDRKTVDFMPHPCPEVCECGACDRRRIMEAARKWDETFSNVAENALSDEFGKITNEQLQATVDELRKSRDPDGVGEGWRRLRVGEDVVAGDDVRDQRIDNGEWKTVRLAVEKDQLNGREYRRRITSEATQ